MIKETYNFSVKQKSRKQILRFVVKNIKKPKFAKILCFPGHECLEIYEIWDKAGVPRENITCLEHNKEVYQEILSRN